MSSPATNTRWRRATGFWDAIHTGSLAQVRSALAEGQNVNAVAGDGQTPLHIAAAFCRHEICATLLAAGSDVNKATAPGTMVLHVASSTGDVELCIGILDAGACVNAVTARGLTSLHLAARHGHLEACHALLAAGAGVNALDVVGSTPLWLTSNDDAKLLPVRRLLISYGARASDLPTTGLATELPNYVAAVRAGAWSRRAAALAAWVQLNDLTDGVPSLAERAFAVRSVQ